MSLKILVADDSITIQKIIALAFRDEDAVVETVAEGGAAMDLVHTFEPDVLLVDAFLPGCNGYEMCARIKDDPELENTPVLLLVGTFEPYDEAEGARVGCDGFLAKPFDTAELIQTVHNMADKRILARNCKAPGEARVMGVQGKGDGQAGMPGTGTPHRISRKVCASYLGADRILDLFDEDALRAAGPALAVNESFAGSGPLPQDTATTKAGVEIDSLISQDTMDLIVDRVVRKISAEAIREVAWEVVPELSETIIRQTIEEQQNKT